MRRFELILCLSSLFASAACGADSPSHHAPDAAPSNVPRTLAGTFAVTSEIDVPMPPAASQALAPFTAAVDGADDPSRYLLDRMVDTLPAGPVRTLAQDAVPLIAPYINAQLSQVSPRLVGGLHALAVGLEQIARHVGTIETWQVAPSGQGTRIVTGARFAVGAEPVAVRFSDHGLDDRIATMQLVLDAEGHVAIGEHGLPLAYGTLLRLGLDLAVVPSVDPPAHDLATALADLIDCDRLGELVATEVGIGTTAIYRAACVAATVAIADDVYTHLAAIDGGAPLVLEMSGSALGYDADRDGSLDELRAGTWSGKLQDVGPIGGASFSGTRAN
jgi:hypothetical protein